MSSESDRELLRRFEPVIRYTKGEKFFPIDVQPYIARSSLWMIKPGHQPVCLVPEGELTLEELGQPRTSDFGTIYYLKFIEPLNIKELATYKLKGITKKYRDTSFHPGRGRLARVGYGSRFVAALFSLSLLARGRVPGDTAVAAVQACEGMTVEDPTHRYYGRVVRQNGWLALQYWFFYPFNNWRSGFFGANDHEADWEMIYIYLSEANNGDITPEWAAYASHDFSGDDLRRHWDDPELERVGDHPVIYAGAGSHASYYSAGEYIAELVIPLLSPLVRLEGYLQDLWRKIVREMDDGGPPVPMNIFRIPFVDYARGDGLTIGPGGEIEWAEPRLLNPPPAWALHYHGLWGWFARDPVAGENAPAGPVYNRNGEVRQSWFDPLGWAGLDKLPPSDEIVPRLLERIREIERRRKTLAEEIAEKSDALTNLGVESSAMQGQAHLQGLYEAYQGKIAALSSELRTIRAQYAMDGALLEALDIHSKELLKGTPEPARAHIHRAHRPVSDTGLRLGRLAELWAAISIGLIMLSFLGVVIFARQYLFPALVSVLLIILFVEASFRRQLTRFINAISIGLAIVAAFILIYDFFWTIMVVIVILAGGYIMFENIRELRA